MYDTLRQLFRCQSAWSAIVVLKTKIITAKTSLRILRQTYTDAVLKTIIPRNTDIRAAHFHRQGIFGCHAPGGASLARQGEQRRSRRAGPGHANVTVTLAIYGNQDGQRVKKTVLEFELPPFDELT